MLTTATKLKEAFPRFHDREPNFDCCPGEEDWLKVEKICQVLEVFYEATKVIFGSNYSTSNLCLTKVHNVKLILDQKLEDENDFICAMTRKMKIKFDKTGENVTY